MSLEIRNIGAKTFLLDMGKNHQALTIIDILFATRMEAGFKVKVEKRIREIRFLVISLT